MTQLDTSFRCMDLLCLPFPVRETSGENLLRRTGEKEGGAVPSVRRLETV